MKYTKEKLHKLLVDELKNTSNVNTFLTLIPLDHAAAADNPNWLVFDTLYKEFKGLYNQRLKEKIYSIHTLDDSSMILLLLDININKDIINACIALQMVTSSRVLQAVINRVTDIDVLNMHIEQEYYYRCDIYPDILCLNKKLSSKSYQKLLSTHDNKTDLALAAHEHTPRSVLNILADKDNLRTIMELSRRADLSKELKKKIDSKINSLLNDEITPDRI